MSELRSRAAFLGARSGVVSVAYAVVAGTLSAAISAPFVGLSGRILGVVSRLEF